MQTIYTVKFLGSFLALGIFELSNIFSHRYELAGIQTEMLHCQWSLVVTHSQSSAVSIHKQTFLPPLGLM